MRVVLLSVGKPKDTAAAELHDRYAARIERLGIQYRSAWVADASPGRRADEPLVRRRETARLLERVETGTVVALDRRGRMLDSETLARTIERWATPCLTLLVGGPLGLHPDLIAGIGERWSLSPLTYPHEIVRSLVAEQVYRALTIARGLPYHK